MTCVNTKPLVEVPEPLALGHWPIEVFRSEQALMRCRVRAYDGECELDSDDDDEGRRPPGCNDTP
eukprot:7177868-Prorocentrum_lima.AAC.1